MGDNLYVRKIVFKNAKRAIKHKCQNGKFRIKICKKYPLNFKKYFFVKLRKTILLNICSYNFNNSIYDDISIIQIILFNKYKCNKNKIIKKYVDIFEKMYIILL